MGLWTIDVVKHYQYLRELAFGGSRTAQELEFSSTGYRLML